MEHIMIDRTRKNRRVTRGNRRGRKQTPPLHLFSWVIHLLAQKRAAAVEAPCLFMRGNIHPVPPVQGPKRETRVVFTEDWHTNQALITTTATLTMIRIGNLSHPQEDELYQAIQAASLSVSSQNGGMSEDVLHVKTLFPPQGYLSCWDMRLKGSRTVVGRRADEWGEYMTLIDDWNL